MEDFSQFIIQRYQLKAIKKRWFSFSGFMLIGISALFFIKGFLSITNDMQFSFVYDFIIGVLGIVVSIQLFSIGLRLNRLVEMMMNIISIAVFGIVMVFLAIIELFRSSIVCNENIDVLLNFLLIVAILMVIFAFPNMIEQINRAINPQRKSNFSSIINRMIYFLSIYALTMFLYPLKESNDTFQLLAYFISSVVFLTSGVFLIRSSLLVKSAIKVNSK